MMTVPDTLKHYVGLPLFWVMLIWAVSVPGYATEGEHHLPEAISQSAPVTIFSASGNYSLTDEGDAPKQDIGLFPDASVSLARLKVQQPYVPILASPLSWNIAVLVNVNRLKVAISNYSLSQQLTISNLPNAP
ncbi:hypothetical protein [Pontibacter burrus]|uniref:Uncharacterized protein n=1 Tax=Pontibacter burrus TaxID=2704466 RepID=A0A6B3LYB3_9BACT|nr:hypothetical protein [Pontibacter burrus]NEM98487.1 hypothetical protein [Pontibacter burrus]